MLVIPPIHCFARKRSLVTAIGGKQLQRRDGKGRSLFSIRLESDLQDRAFIEKLNSRLTEVIDAPTHTADEVRSFQDLFTATAWDGKTGKNATFIAIDDDGNKVDYVNVREGTDDVLGEPCGYIALLAVKSSHESRGIARALIQRAEEWAAEVGFDRVALDVFASNDRALKFYERAGFEAETIRVVKRL